MSTYRTLFAGDGWSVGLWRCDAPEPGLHPPERTTEHQVVFPTHGSYGRTVAGVREVLDATRVVYFNPGEWYEVDHPVAGGDRCTVLSLDPVLIESLVSSESGLRDVPGVGPRFARTSRPTEGRLHLAQHRLVTRTRHRGADPIALEQAALHLARAALPAVGPRPVRRHRVRVERTRARAVDRALEKIHAEFRSPLSVVEIARAAAYSPFHLGRVFRARTGLTLHRYIQRLRLREALDELLAGDGAIGAVALRYGFSSHSHFSDAFRREFGESPGSARLRAGASAGQE